ncbi:hypothetical protein HGRIS_010460 [Hohenbuehelia grisea]|uniref:Uncharacterized protein n=1 Tax=Hohenbuehelia grisea TaxID=104357 RepID=A0ABR3IZ83_9AGAR
MQDLDDEKIETYKNALIVHRSKEGQGARLTNRGVSQDMRHFIDSVTEEVNKAYQRTGMVMLGFASASHVDDGVAPALIMSPGAEEFCMEELSRDPLALLQHFNLWACRPKEGLITKKPDINMNYINYETAIVSTYRIRLVGWPKDVKFTAPSLITSLKPEEVRTHQDALADRREAGEVVGKKRKTRSDKGKPRKSYAPRKSAKAKSTRSRSGGKKSSRRREDNSEASATDDEDDHREQDNGVGDDTSHDKEEGHAPHAPHNRRGKRARTTTQQLRTYHHLDDSHNDAPPAPTKQEPRRRSHRQRKVHATQEEDKESSSQGSSNDETLRVR